MPADRKSRARGKATPPSRSNNEIRQILLEYFHQRNAIATSARGKQGVSARISAVRKDLKASHGLSQQEIWSNLTYLISQGWVEEERIEKSVPLRTGTVIPQVTPFYKITALGIDKIEGPGEFTVDRFKGIKIEATGQNIITVGDGNQVNARFQEAAGALVELKQAVLQASGFTEAQKLETVADIETIQSQLAKAEPNRSVIRSIWEGVEKAATGVGLVANATKVAELLAPLF